MFQKPMAARLGAQTSAPRRRPAAFAPHENAPQAPRCRGDPARTSSSPIQQRYRLLRLAGSPPGSPPASTKIYRTHPNRSIRRRVRALPLVMAGRYAPCPATACWSASVSPSGSARATGLVRRWGSASGWLPGPAATGSWSAGQAGGRAAGRIPLSTDAEMVGGDVPALCRLPYPTTATGAANATAAAPPRYQRLRDTSPPGVAAGHHPPRPRGRQPRGQGGPPRITRVDCRGNGSAARGTVPAMMRITSARNPRVRAALELAKARERDRRGLFAVEGAREIGRALAAGLEPEEGFWLAEAELSGPAAEVVASLRARPGLAAAEVR